jgi:hypothetical protein
MCRSHRTENHHLSHQQAAEKLRLRSNPAVFLRVALTQTQFAGCSKRLSGKAAASEEARRTLRYVESLSDGENDAGGLFQHPVSVYPLSWVQLPDSLEQVHLCDSLAHSFSRIWNAVAYVVCMVYLVDSGRFVYPKHQSDRETEETRQTKQTRQASGTSQAGRLFQHPAN